MTPEISFAIATYRRPDYLRQALASITVNCGRMPGGTEVVVTDNGPDDQAEQVAAEQALSLGLFMDKEDEP